MFHGHVRAQKLIELPPVIVVGMDPEDSKFGPPVHGLLVNAEPIGHLFPVQHSPLTKPIISRTQAIGVREIGYVLGRKAVVRPAWTCRCFRVKPSLIEDAGDFGIDMVVEQSINELPISAGVLICCADDFGSSL